MIIEEILLSKMEILELKVKTFSEQTNFRDQNVKIWGLKVKIWDKNQN